MLCIIVGEAFRNVVIVAETDPTNAKQLIAYRTIRSFYQQMCNEFPDTDEAQESLPVSEQTFYRIMDKEFPEIRFVKVIIYAVFSFRLAIDGLMLHNFITLLLSSSGVHGNRQLYTDHWRNQGTLLSHFSIIF